MFLAPLIPLLGGGMSAAMTGISAASGLATGIAGGMAQKSAAEYNANVASMQAQQAQQRGIMESDALSRDQQQELGTTRSKAAASGTLMGSGGTDQIITNTMEQQQRDQRMLQYNTELAMWGHEAEATNQRAAGKNAMTTGIIGGISSGISSFASNPALRGKITKAVS